MRGAWSLVDGDPVGSGFPLGKLLERVEPGPRAKYRRVHFPPASRGDARAEEGRSPTAPIARVWRIDEAMKPLTILAVGLYRARCCPTRTAPRCGSSIPWKYGSRGSSAIVRIHLMPDEPVTTWNVMAPQEYGFYANVNPEVDHPRWSQHERAADRRVPQRKTYVQRLRRPRVPECTRAWI